MNNDPPPSTPEGILEDLRRLTEARSPRDLLADATGLFVPGFTALPCVSIIAAKPPRDMKSYEELTAGHLLSFESATPRGCSDRRVLTFFTPLGDIRIGPVTFSEPARKTKGSQEIQIESDWGWNDARLGMAWVPWDRMLPSLEAKADALMAAVATRNPRLCNLGVVLVVEGKEVPLSPQWGLPGWVPDASVESVVFPVRYARRLLDPFFFTLVFPEAANLPNMVTLRFTFPEPELNGLYAMAGLGKEAARGFSVIGNAIPVANFDLKAWEPDLTYADFVKATDMKPLGFAGVARFKRRAETDSPQADLEPYFGVALPVSAQFSVGFDSSGEVVSRHAMGDGLTGSEDRQLLFWMTHGEGIAGMTFRYAEADVVQPMQRTSASLKDAVTLIPCFGGYASRDVPSGDLYRSLLLNYNLHPEQLLYGEGLKSTVADLLCRLGYRDRAVDGPVIELRLTEDGRERVCVVYVMDNVMDPIKPHHLAAVQDFLDQRVPLGNKVLLETRRR